MKCSISHAPMGWNSYDYYDTTVNEQQVRANAEFMAEHLKEAGWEYVVVDIQWYAKNPGSMREQYQYIPFGGLEMDGFGRLQPDVERFPSSAGGRGFGPLAEYIHSLGLRFGIHIMRGIPRQAAEKHLPVWGADVTAADIADPSSICGWNPDMYGVRKNVSGAQEYYDSIISLYADWGEDFIKCDDICNTNLYPHNPYSAAHEIEMLQRAIQRSGREMVLSLSPGPALIEKAWHYQKYANMWRITDDFWDDWALLRNMFDRCELWQDHRRAGCYPDCDMLPLGRLGKGFGAERNTRFSKEEQRCMLSLWCIFGSPLMIGAELTKLDSETLSLLKNQEAFRLTHSAFQGRQFEKNDGCAIWSSKNRETGERYIALFNFLPAPQEISCLLTEVEQFAEDFTPVLKAKELWTQEEIPLQGELLGARLAPHDGKLFKLIG